MASPLDELDALVSRADLDGLVRHVDAACAAREWDHLVRVRDRSRAAVDTGRQLWPIATLANYRLALWAPAELAVRALDDTARTFMPGPVSEIIAVHHRWEDLEQFLAPGHDRSLVAHERALRGDVIGADEHSALDIPMEVQPWEPRYEPASYSDDGVDAPMPDTPRTGEPVRTAPGASIEDPETVTAFRSLTEPWTAQSNGSARCTVSEGGIGEALGAHGLRSARIARIDVRQALDLLAWAGASGGAHGKRRGLATGRSNAWWFLATFAGMQEDWPCDPDELGVVLGGMTFAVWDDDDTTDDGWNVRLVIEDTDEGIACIVSARDHA